jgi:hypothetical protein
LDSDDKINIENGDAVQRIPIFDTWNGTIRLQTTSKNSTLNLLTKRE